MAGLEIPRVKLGNQGLEVSRLGFGCMSLSGIYNSPLSDEDGIAIIKDAYSKGITFFDTADAYGANANEVLVGKMHELKKLVEEGKIKYIGLYEASPDTIRRAHRVHPITAVQMEWSLWTRDIEEEIVPLCRELGIGIVAYSPLGRGFFGGKAIVGHLSSVSSLVEHPRFKKENLNNNKIIYSRIEDLARKHRCSTAQLALAWLLEHGNRVVPIPGTTKIKNLDSNIGSLKVNLTEGRFERDFQCRTHRQGGRRQSIRRLGSRIMDVCKHTSAYSESLSITSSRWRSWLPYSSIYGPLDC
ncbi:probable aldo-keto reductase 1 isoform X4 [Syzygium oleosum]|uniref:probable aldo-keto reductase 1 isoform X4 n=1 Tax=Syzygium oleosum TaxID=219896 RepID=UPI0024BB7548|nr:probable aldo-keto reductase 1 isoform X4 [Syzygium oleosum]